MPDVSWQELRDDTDEVLRRIEAGESFTITRDVVAVAEPVPLTGEQHRWERQ